MTLRDGESVRMRQIAALGRHDWEALDGEGEIRVIKVRITDGIHLLNIEGDEREAWPVTRKGAAPGELWAVHRGIEMELWAVVPECSPEL